GGKVVGGEEGTRRLGFDGVPLAQDHGLDREVGRDVDRAPEHGQRQEGILELGTCGTQRGHVDRVDRVYAAGQKGALAPADHLATQAQRQQTIAHEEVAVDVGVEQAGTLGGLILGAPGQDVHVLEGEVIEIVAADKGAEVVEVDRQLGVDASLVEDQVPLVEVE